MIRQQMLAELQASEELDKLEEEFEQKKLQRKRELVMKRLKIQQMMEESDDDGSDGKHEEVLVEKTP
ncbi:unnamed protein product, partial [Allacma fusca]